MKISRPISRRAVLKGGAVALSLPWLETFAPRNANAASAPIKRYMNMYYPNGTTPNFWFPKATGTGTAWSISPILEPLSAFKANMLVLNNVGNYSAMGVTTTAQPSHGTNCAGAWHCFDPRKGSDSAPAGGISIDQVIAAQIGSATKLPSMQVGLSTLDSYCDGAPCAHSRSLSWAGPNMPLGKVVNPQAVFDRLVSAGAPTGTSTGTGTGTTTTTPNPALAQQRALQKSVLDSVVGAATTLRTKLSKSDQTRVDQYMTSVRDLEKLVSDPAMAVGGSGSTGGGATASCVGQTRPPEAYADMNTPADYSRETHANLMIQLVTLAFACDLTRVVSFMMDDARSDFVYSHVPNRLFNTPAAGTLSSPGSGTCAGYHGLQHAGDNNDGFATITWWMASKVAMMATALQSISEGGGTALDGAVIHFGSGMHGGNHDGLNIPMAIIGSGGGILKQNANLVMDGDAPGGGARLANLHMTIATKVFNSPITTFGAPGASTGIVPGVLA